jgi:VWFA-related protein
VDARGLTPGDGSKNIQTMEQFAGATGGLAYYNRNDLSVAIEAAIEDLKFTYVMGFYLNEKDRDRRYHTLKVETDSPGTTLRFRRGYTPLDATPDGR